MAKVTVLIADDLKFFLEVEKSYLVRGGFDVLTAATGREAIALASSRRPQLVLLDLEMPEMDGAAACAEMRAKPELAATPIIIMSATTDANARDRCLKAGCTEFVRKPEKPEELLGIVARILSVKKRETDRLTVIFNVTGKDHTRQIIGQAKNLSSTGLLLETATPLNVGTSLTIEFFLPKTRVQIKTKAEVMRSSKAADGTHQAGLRFVDLDAGDQEQILDYIGG